MPRWEHPAHTKIHEGCGGVVRWVEAVHRQSVGYTGECLECGEKNIVIEDIIPIEAPDFDLKKGIWTSDLDVREGLEWDEAVDWESNQERLRQAFTVDADRRGDDF